MYLSPYNLRQPAAIRGAFEALKTLVREDVGYEMAIIVTSHVT
ncbi:MAG: hypothetical protein ABIO40_08445 [Devosia sp.]